MLLWLASIIVTGLLLLSAVAGRLPFLAAYAAASLARSGLLLFAGQGTTAYYFAWLYTEPVLVGLRFGFALEAYLLLASPHRNMGPWRAGIPLAATLAAASLMAMAGAETPLYASLSRAYAIGRYSWAVLALGLVGAAFVAVVPANRPRWIVLHYWCAALFCFSQAIPFALAYATGEPWGDAGLVGAIVTQGIWVRVLICRARSYRASDHTWR